MLHEFLTANRKELIARCRDKVAKRFDPDAAPAAANAGVPLFLQQLTDTLHLEESTPFRNVSDAQPATGPSAASRAATAHGASMLDHGFTIGQVVHSYGDVCQSVTELAIEQRALISADEFHTLNRCLDDAIADAVTAFGQGHQALANDRAESLHNRLADFADEYQRLVEIAIQSHSAIKTGAIGFGGATGTLLAHTLRELRDLGDRMLPEIRQENATATPRRRT
jgi:hypothetical protein